MIRAPAGERRFGGVVVDAFVEGVGVVDDLLALGRLFAFDRDRIRVLGREVVDLFLQFGFAVAGGRGDFAVHLLVAFRRSDERRQLRPADVAQHVHQKQAVLGRGVARAELGVGPGLAEDVGHAELLVADDHGAVVRGQEGLDAFGLRQVGREAGVLVEAADFGCLQVRGDLEQVGVQRLLVSRVGGEAQARFRLEEVFSVIRPRLPRRDDVEHLSSAAVDERAADGPLPGHALTRRRGASIAERRRGRQRVYRQQARGHERNRSRPPDTTPSAYSHRPTSQTRAYGPRSPAMQARSHCATSGYFQKMRPSTRRKRDKPQIVS